MHIISLIFELPDAPGQAIGRYGRMRKVYLEEHRPGLYERLILSGKFYEHLADIDVCCAERMMLLSGISLRIRSTISRVVS